MATKLTRDQDKLRSRCLRISNSRITQNINFATLGPMDIRGWNHILDTCESQLVNAESNNKRGLAGRYG